MKLSDLIKKIGDKNIEFQSLDTAGISLDYNTKTGTRITFGTDEPIGPSGTKRLGLIVWLPRESVDKITAKEHKLQGGAENGLPVEDDINQGEL